MTNLSESGHPPVRGTSALSRGSLKSKEGGKPSIHYNGDSATAELVLRIIISVNQLSINGAVSDRCEELAQQISDHPSSSTGKLVAKMNDESESKVAPTVVGDLDKFTFDQCSSPGKLGAATQRKIRKPSRRHLSE